MRHPEDDAFAAHKMVVMKGRVGEHEEFMGEYYYSRGGKMVHGKPLYVKYFFDEHGTPQAQYLFYSSVGRWR